MLFGVRSSAEDEATAAQVGKCWCYLDGGQPADPQVKAVSNCSKPYRERVGGLGGRARLCDDGSSDWHNNQRHAGRKDPGNTSY